MGQFTAEKPVAPGSALSGNQHTGPMMRRATGFNPHQARSQLRKKRQNLRAADRSADDNIAQCVHCMDLKNVLRQIKANGANFHDGWLLRSFDASITSTPWRMP